MQTLMDDRSDREEIVLTDEQMRRRRARSIAIALALVVLVILFYAATVVKLGPGILNRPL
jgi:archaellum biogenesis protein FlaJ (TadC family)